MVGLLITRNGFKDIRTGFMVLYFQIYLQKLNKVCKAFRTMRQLGIFFRTFSNTQITRKLDFEHVRNFASET